MNETKSRVVIVGGGPAGSFAALYLATMSPETAEDIVLLEAKHQGRDKICAGGVSGRVMATAGKDLGIDLTRVPGREADGIIIRFRDRTAVVERPRLARVVRRDALDSFLLDRVRERGVAVLTETPVTNVTRSRDRISAETAGGTFTGDVLIGADGVHGITKKSLGVGAGRHKEYLLYADLPDVEVPPKLTLDYTPILSGVPGYAWFFPNNPGGTGANGGITGGSPRNMKLLREQFLLMAEKNLGRRPDEKGLKLRPYPERFFSFSTPSYSDRALFVGDKLGVTPMTGEGIGICLSSAGVAAGEALAALKSGDFSFRGYPRRLATCDFVPTWALEQAFLRWKTPFLFDLFFTLATGENRPNGRSFFDDYCRVFAGEMPSWSVRSWATLLKVLPSTGLVARSLRDLSKRITP